MFNSCFSTSEYLWPVCNTWAINYGLILCTVGLAPARRDASFCRNHARHRPPLYLWPTSTVSSASASIPRTMASRMASQRTQATATLGILDRYCNYFSEDTLVPFAPTLLFSNKRLCFFYYSGIRVPYPEQWGGPTFDTGEAFAMMAASFVALVEV